MVSGVSLRQQAVFRGSPKRRTLVSLSAVSVLCERSRRRCCAKFYTSTSSRLKNIGTALSVTGLFRQPRINQDDAILGFHLYFSKNSPIITATFTRSSHRSCPSVPTSNQSSSLAAVRLSSDRPASLTTRVLKPARF